MASFYWLCALIVTILTDDQLYASSFQTLAYDRLRHHGISGKDGQSHTRAMLAANCWTDHQMLRSKWQRQRTSKQTRFNTSQLSTSRHRESFEQKMDSSLAQWEEKESSTPDEEWATLQQVVYNTAKTYLRKRERKYQDWFVPNDQELQTEQSRREQAHQRMLQTRSQTGGKGRQWSCRDLLTETP